MLNAKPNHKRILELLSDGKVHFSSEFRDHLQLLEYRKRISELRREPFKLVIKSLRVKDSFGNLRPAYQLQKSLDERTLFA